MLKLVDINYSEIDVIRILWEKNRVYHQTNSQFFGDEYRNLSFDERIKAFANYDGEAIKITVAQLKDEYVGYCISTIVDGRGEVASLHVDEGNRGKGIGRHLANNHLEWMKERNSTVIGVTVSQENEAAKAFYRGLGFFPNTLYMQMK